MWKVRDFQQKPKVAQAIGKKRKSQLILFTKRRKREKVHK